MGWSRGKPPYDQLRPPPPPVSSNQTIRNLFFSTTRYTTTLYTAFSEPLWTVYRTMKSVSWCKLPALKPTRTPSFDSCPKATILRLGREAASSAVDRSRELQSRVASSLTPKYSSWTRRHQHWILRQKVLYKTRSIMCRRQEQRS